jgi:hypothetical protein
MKLGKLLCLTAILLYSTISKAQDPNVMIYVDHGSYNSAKEYEFDIMIKATGATSSFQLRTFQAGLYLDPTWVNGGVLNIANVSTYSQMNGAGYNGAFQWNAVDKLVNCSVNFDVLGTSGCIATTVTSTPIVVTRIRLSNNMDFGCSSPNIKFNYVNNISPLRLRTSFSWRAVGCTSNFDMFYPGRTYTGNATFNGELYSVSDADGKSTINAAGNTGFCADELIVNAFITGYYLGAGQMQSALLNQGVLHAQPDQSDSITVELRAANSPYNLVYSQTTILRTDGKAHVIIPSNLSLTGTSYWIVLVSRNATQTWSKTPVLLSNRTTFDFTSL